MTPRGIVLAWIVALCVLAGTLALAVRVLGPVGETDRVVPTAPVVFVGSSIVRNAIPSTGEGAEAALGDGRAHVRLAAWRMSEERCLALVSAAIDAGARTILVELNVFAFDFANERPVRMRGAVPGLRATVNDALRLSRQSQRVVLAGLGLQPPEPGLTDEAPQTDRPIAAPREWLARTYPLHLREPRLRGALRRVIARARDAGIEVVFLAPPRSETAARFMGDEAVAALDAHMRRLAAEAGVALFAPAPYWPDAYFVDAAHMNRDGRARFVAALRAWWAARP